MTDSITITVKAGPGFEHVLPKSSDDEVELTFPAQSVLDDVVAKLDIDGNARFLTAVNDDVIMKAQRATTELQAGDIVEILPPLTGG